LQTSYFKFCYLRDIKLNHIQDITVKKKTVWSLKNAFHHKYFAHKTLNLSEIGFQSDQKVYIIENWTKFNQEIYAASMKLKANDKKLHTVSTSQGVVSVKRPVGDRSYASHYEIGAE
jgi:hypothetical protein